MIFLYLLPTMTMSLGLILLGNYDFEGPLTPRESQGALIIFVAAVWSLLTTPGFIYMQTKAVAGKPVSASKAFQKALPRLWPLVMSSVILAGLAIVVLTTLGTVIGISQHASGSNSFSPGATNILQILIIASIVIGLRFFVLAPYFIVAKGSGPWEGLRHSYSETKDVSAWMWGTIGVFAVFTAPALAISIGLPGVGDVISTFILLPYIFAFAFRFAEVSDKTPLKLDQPAK